MRFPSPLHTERLIVRFPVAEDAAELNAAIHETWDDLHMWMAWAAVRPTLEESREKCAQLAASGEEFHLFGFERETGRLVLANGVRCLDPEVPSFDLGYWCRASFQGQGFVTEATRAVIETCFETMGAQRIEIRCDVKNDRSQAVALRCGARHEGDLVNECRDPQGNLRTTRIFALTPSLG
ncbi:MAG: GNAT family N-acetyltransferase [Fimbriimonas sp.]